LSAPLPARRCITAGKREYVARYIGSKLIHLAIVLAIVSFLTYLLMDIMPGGIEYSLFGSDATLAEIELARENLNLDDPFIVRYGRWLGDAVTGDFGQSFRDNRPVIEDIKPRLPVTFELAAFAMLIALVFAVPMGVYQAYREEKLVDRTFSFSAILMISIPQFLCAVILINIFAVKLGWFPVSGFTRISQGGLKENLKSLTLPAFSLAFAEMAVLSQVLRADMVTTLKEDYILSARAKGMP